MPRRREILLKLTQTFDGLMLGLIFWATHGLRFVLGEHFTALQPIPEFDRFLWLLAVIIPFSPIVLEYQGFYNHPLRKKPGDSTRQIGKGLVVMALIFGLCVIFLKWSTESRSVLLLFMGISGIALLIRDAAARFYLSHRNARLDWRHRIVLAGDPDDMDQVVANMPEEDRGQIEIVGRVDLSEKPVTELTRIFRQHAPERVVFAADHVNFRTVEKAIHVCETEGVEAWLAADFMNPTISRMQVEMLGSSPMLVFRSTPDHGWSLMLKEMTDRIGALALIALTSPLWIFAAIGVRLTSPSGPVVFRQERSGRYGKPFTMLKFRTMHPDAEARRNEIEAANEMEGPAFKMTNDPRVFAVGSLLRKLSIDELPQLWNVVRGEMSLVGPRPLPIYEVEKIEDSAQRRRLSVKPGLTCLWQIGGRNRIQNFEDWVNLDLEYIDNWSLWLDWKILARTVPAVLSGAGAR